MANQVRTIFANMSWMMIANIVTSLLAFVWTIFTARYLGVSDYGLFGFAVSTTALFNVINDLGMGTQIVRAIATDNSVAEKYLGNAFPLKLMLAIVYFIVIFLILIVLKSSYLTMIVTLLMAFEVVIQNLTGLLNSTFQAFERLKYNAFSSMIVNGLNFILILGAIFFDLGLFGIVFAYITANCCALIYNIFILRGKFVIPKLEVDPAFCKKLLIVGIPFAITGVCYTIYYQIDIIMLTTMVGDYATGMYNATYKLINVLSLFYAIYSAVVFPVMSKLYKSKKNMLNFGFEKSIKYLLLITIPLSFGMSFYASDLIVFVYGTQYAYADAILQILIWTIVFLFVNGACTNLLNASHKEVSVTKIYIIAAIFNICVNFVLIPRYSYIGASVATVLSDILICIICFYVLKQINQLPRRKLIVDILKIVISTGVLAIALYILNLSMWLALPVGIIIYFVVIFLLKTLDEDDINILRQLKGN